MGGVGGCRGVGDGDKRQAGSWEGTRLGQVALGLVWGVAGRWDAAKAWTSCLGTRLGKLGTYKSLDKSLLALLEAGKIQSLDKFLWDSFGALLEDGTLRKLGQVGWGLVWGVAGRWDATKAWTSRFGPRWG